MPKINRITTRPNPAQYPVPISLLSSVCGWVTAMSNRQVTAAVSKIRHDRARAASHSAYYTKSASQSTHPTPSTRRPVRIGGNDAPDVLTSTYPAAKQGLAPHPAKTGCPCRYHSNCATDRQGVGQHDHQQCRCTSKEHNGQQRRSRCLPERTRSSHSRSHSSRGQSR